MRTNNSRAKTLIISIYFILVIAAIFAAVFSFFNELSQDNILTFLFIMVGFIVVFIVVHLLSKYFEYDSDGSQIIITNKGLLLTDRYDYREHIIEFDKNDLIAFKFQNYIVYKSLMVWYKDASGTKCRDVFNVTLVRDRKIKYIKQSLSKMVRQNLKKKNV